MNLGWPTTVSLGFTVIAIIAYWWTCWKCGFNRLNLCYSILLRIFARRSTSRGNGWMSRELGVDSGEAIHGTLLREVVKVHVVFRWIRGKQRYWTPKQQGHWAGTAQVPGQLPPTQSKLLFLPSVAYKWSSYFTHRRSRRQGSTGLLHSVSPKGQEAIALAY